MSTPPPDYSAGLPPMSDAEWIESPEFDLNWITGLFNVASKSLGALYGTYDQFNLNQEDLLNMEELDAQEFVNDSVGPIVYICIWAAVALIFTILSVCWCCANKCVCCCRSSFEGGKNDHHESADPRYQLRPYYSERNKGGNGKHSYVAIVIVVLMAIWLVGFLIMILHAFSSNEKIKESFDGINGKLNDEITNIEKYLDITFKQLEYAMDGSFETLNIEVQLLLKDCPDCALEVPIITAEEEVKKAHIDIHDLISGLNKTAPIFDGKESLTEPKNTMSSIRQSESIKTQVENAMGEVDEELDRQLKKLNDAVRDVQTTVKDAKSSLDGDYEDVMTNTNNGLYWGIMLFNVLYVIAFALVLVGTVLATFSKGGSLKFAGYLSYRVAIVLMCVLFIFVVAQMLIAFIFAGVVSEIICPAVRRLEVEPQTSTGSPYQESDSYAVPSYPEIIRRCQKDESAYKAFNLKQAYDVENVKKLIEKFDNFIPPLTTFPESRDVEIISKDLEIKQTGPVDTIQKIKDEVTKYTDFVVSAVENDVGKCVPFYKTVNKTINMFCYEIVAPVASYWWILQFIPPTFLFIFITALFFERFHF